MPIAWRRPALWTAPERTASRTHPPQLILGVDTHNDVHVAVVLDRLGRYLAAASFGTSDAANSDLVAWTRRYGQVARQGRGHRPLAQPPGRQIDLRNR